tara:strand:- start:134 stop:442 length:309 start_codon:yes stop_codon:yes gene_type:complete
MTEKKYLNNLVIKEQSGEYGSFFKLWIPDLQEFISELSSMEKENSVNLIMSKRKEKSKGGVTHYTYLDTWEPNKKDENQNNSITPEQVQDIFSKDLDPDEPF